MIPALGPAAFTVTPAEATRRYQADPEWTAAREELVRPTGPGETADEAALRRLRAIAEMFRVETAHTAEATE